MNIELLVQDSKSGIIYDLSEVTAKIEWTTQIDGQPGKLEFTFLDEDGRSFSKGSIVSLKNGNQGIFYGYLFSHAVDHGNGVKFTCYDQLRYFKNKDTYVFGASTLSQRFSQLCKDKKINHKIVQSSSYSLPAKVMDNKTYYDMLQDAIDETLIKTGEWFLIKDNFGVLEQVNINSLKTDLFIGDESLLNQYEFTTSIDSDSFNRVKLIKENKETKKREVFIVEDSSNIKKWGELQYFEKVDEKANNAQIKERAERLLKIKNRETKVLKLACLGDLRASAGAGVVVGVEKLNEQGLPKNQYYLIKACKHTFENEKHLMTLEMQVSV